MNEVKPAHKADHSSTIIAITFIASLSYAILRYHIMGPVPWKDFPFFILNKGVSLCAFILLAVNFSIGPLQNLGAKVSERWLNARKLLGITGFLLVILHAIISFLLFKKEVYTKFFEADGTVSLYAGLAMLCGIIGFIVLWIINNSHVTYLREDESFIKFINSRKFMLTAIFLSAGHVFFMGFKGWMTPEKWHGGLPPISLLAFSFFLVGFIINLFGRK